MSWATTLMFINCPGYLLCAALKMLYGEFLEAWLLFVLAAFSLALAVSWRREELQQDTEQ